MLKENPLDCDRSQWIGNAKTIRYFSLGRHALVAALKMLQIGRGDSVLIPEFICRDLLASLHALQVEPLFYPVDRQLAPVDLPTRPDVKAVLAVNFFGFPQEIAPFRRYCESNKAFLIEDNAHGFLSSDAQGIRLGSRGDLAIFSYRKTFHMINGAGLQANREDLVQRLPDGMDCSDANLPPNFLIKKALWKVQDATGISITPYGEKMVRGIRKAFTGNAIPAPDPESEFTIPDAAAIHCDSIRILEHIHVSDEIKRRRGLFHEFRLVLKDIDIDPVFNELPENVSPYGFAFRASPANAARVAVIASDKGFNSAFWPCLPSEIVAAAPEYYKNVYWVNFLC